MDLRNVNRQKPEETAIKSRKFTGGEKVLIGAITLVFLFVFYVTLDANKYKALVRVIEGEGRVGVNPTTEALDFGDLSRGTSAVRGVEIVNATPIPMFIMVLRVGGISELMDLDKNNFALSARETERLQFTVFIPASAPVGEEFSGRVFLFKVPGPWRKS